MLSRLSISIVPQVASRTAAVRAPAALARLHSKNRGRWRVNTEDDREDWVTGRLLVTAARLVEHAWNARLRADGVSHAGLIVLSTLGRGPTSQRELAADQHVTEQ